MNEKRKEKFRFGDTQIANVIGTLDRGRGRSCFIMVAIANSECWNHDGFWRANSGRNDY